MPYDFKSAFDFSSRVALVTGAGAGIGKAIVNALHERGATVIFVDRNPVIHDIAKGVDDRHISYEADVSDEASCDHVVSDAVSRLGKIDILVNSAGIAILEPAEETTLAAWNKTLAINLTGSFLFSRRVGREMIRQKYGRIVTIASQAASIGLDHHLAYCTSKSALLGMTRVLALEWGKHGVTANTISPTVVETELGKIAWAGEKGEALKAIIPTRRFAQPEEIALAALYLTSEGAGMVNGEDLLVDGGYSNQ